MTLQRGVLVVLSGIDCAGKSTQLDLLRQRASEQGLSAETLWLRPGYSPWLDATRRVLRRVRPGALPTPGIANNARRDAAFRRTDVRVAWVSVALADLWAQYTLRLRGMLLRHDLVLCDRGLVDAKIDFTLRFPEMQPGWSTALRVVDASMPTPDAHVLLTIPREEMILRQARKSEPFPDPPDLRDRRYALYSELKGARIHRVDTSVAPIEETNDRIWQLIETSRALR